MKMNSIISMAIVLLIAGIILPIASTNFSIENMHVSYVYNELTYTYENQSVIQSNTNANVTLVMPNSTLEYNTSIMIECDAFNGEIADDIHDINNTKLIDGDVFVNNSTRIAFTSFNATNLAIIDCINVSGSLYKDCYVYFTIYNSTYNTIENYYEVNQSVYNCKKSFYYDHPFDDTSEQFVDISISNESTQLNNSLTTNNVWFLRVALSSASGNFYWYVDTTLTRHNNWVKYADEPFIRKEMDFALNITYFDIEYNSNDINFKINDTSLIDNIYYFENICRFSEQLTLNYTCDILINFNIINISIVLVNTSIPIYSLNNTFIEININEINDISLFEVEYKLFMIHDSTITSIYRNNSITAINSTIPIIFTSNGLYQINFEVNEAIDTLNTIFILLIVVVSIGFVGIIMKYNNN